MVDEDKLESIFATVLPLSENERSTYLDAACGGDTELRRRVDALLRASIDAGSFFDKPPSGLQATIATGQGDTVDEAAGEISLDFLTPSDNANCLGTLDQYEVMEVVGRGGMGIVLRAYDTKLNRVVAIKAMAPELAANAMAVKRFLREARAAAAVSHDHVVSIFAIHDDNRPPFIVMEFVDGQSLQEKIDASGALELKEILRVGMQMARGLSAAHGQGLVHRDIKPANILLENGVERVKITDFGLARAVDDVSVTQTGQIAGTPQFMSPEQAQGHLIDARSDLFSFGSVLYTICTGRPPFRGDSAVEMLRRVADDDPRSIREVNAETPDWLEAIIFKLLAKDPDERFQSAEEVAELLSDHLAHLQHPTTAPKPASVTPPKRESKPRPGPVAMFDTSNWSEGKKRFSKYLTITCLLVGLIALAAVIYIQTDRGTVRIEVLDPDAKVVLRCDDGHRRIDIKDYDITIGVRSGDNTLHIKHGDLEFETNKFSVKRGEKVAVRVSRVEGALEVRAGDVVIGRKDLPIQATAPSKSQITEVRRFEGHTDRVFDIAASADGKHVVSVSGDGTARVWDLAGNELRQFKHEGHALSVAISPDGKTVATGDQTGSVYLWKLQTAEKIQRLDAAQGELLDNKGEPRDKSIHALAFSHDGRKLASAGMVGQLRVWDTQSFEELAFIGYPRFITSVTFSPDDSRIAIAGVDNRVSVWDWKAQEQLWGTSGRSLAVFSVAFSPDGRLLAVGDRTGKVFLDDAETGKNIGRLQGHNEGVKRGLHFSADGRRLISASDDRSIRIWDVEGQKELARHETNSHATGRSALLPDGRHLITGGGMIPGNFIRGDGDYALRLWRLPERVWPKEDESELTEVRRFEGHTDRVFGVAASPDGKHIVSGSADGTARVWDIDGNELRQFKHDGHAHGLAISPDGKMVATGDQTGSVFVWNLHTAELIQRLDAAQGELINNQGEPRDKTIHAVAFSHDGGKLVSAGMVGQLRVWDTQSFEELAFIDYPHFVSCAQFSPDDAKIAIGTNDNRVIVYDWKARQQLWTTGHRTRTVNSVAFSADGRLLAVGGRLGKLFVDNAETGNNIGELRGHGSQIHGLHFSADGRRLISTGKDRSIRIWDVGRQQEITRHETQLHVTNRSALLPNGRHLITGGGQLPGDNVRGDGDYALRLWRLPESVWPNADAEIQQLTEVRRFEGLQSDHTYSLDFSADGERLVVGGGVADPHSIVWRVRDGHVLTKLTEAHRIITDVAFTPDGGAIAACGSRVGVLLLDSETGAVIRRFADPATTSGQFALDLSSDGRQLVTAHSNRSNPHLDAAIRIWNVETGQETKRIEFRNAEEIRQRLEVFCTSVRLSPDGRRVLAINSGTRGVGAFVAEYEVDSGREIRRLCSESDKATTRGGSATYSPDGRWIATGHQANATIDQKFDDAENCAIRLWDAQNGRLVKLLRGHRSLVRSLHFSADSRLLVSGSGDQWVAGNEFPGADLSIRVWDVATGREMARATLTQSGRCVRFSPDGSHIGSVAVKRGAGNIPDVQLWRLPENVWPNAEEEGVSEVRRLKAIPMGFDLWPSRSLPTNRQCHSFQEPLICQSGHGVRPCRTTERNRHRQGNHRRFQVTEARQRRRPGDSYRRREG